MEVILHCDSMTTLAYEWDSKLYGKTKQLDIRYLYIKDMAMQGEVVLQHISTGMMVADPLTKPITRDVFLSRARSMGLWDLLHMKNAPDLQKTRFQWQFN